MLKYFEEWLHHQHQVIFLNFTSSSTVNLSLKVAAAPTSIVPNIVAEVPTCIFSVIDAPLPTTIFCSNVDTPTTLKDPIKVEQIQQIIVFQVEFVLQLLKSFSK